MTYQEELLRDKYANAAMSVHGMQQPALAECAEYLMALDTMRYIEKGRYMTEDHLKQAARKWHERSA